MQAVIIAGGEGTRLRPLTSTVPKPLLPIANRPMIAHVVNLLASYGFDDIIVTVAYLGNSIRNYLGDGTEFGVRIRYLQEETPLGTAGAVANAKDLIEGTFIVLSGDVLTDIDLSKAVAFHSERSALATMILTAVESPIEFGIVTTDDEGSVNQLVEKPSWGEVFSDTANTGIYVLEPAILDRIPTGRPVDFSEEVFPSILADKQRLAGYVAEGYWADVGTFSGYVQAHRDILDGRVRVDTGGFRFDSNVIVGKNCEIDPTALIVGPALIGDFVRVGSGARILPYSVIGENVRIGTDTVIDGAILFDHAFLGEEVRLRSAIVGRSADIRNRAVINDMVVLGDNVYVGRDAVINPDLKVYPGKTVEPMSTVTSSIVWETGSSRTVFGPLGISGLANIDINPELATRIAMAFAYVLPPHGSVFCSRDTSRAARVIKRALMVGFNSVGLDVIDLEATIKPLLRHSVANTDAVAGVHVSLDPSDPQSLVIHLLNANGVDLNSQERRKVERALEREDFRRVSASEIGDLRLQSRSLDAWKSEITSASDSYRVREAQFRVVVDYSFGLGAITLPQILASWQMDALAINPYASTARAIELSLPQQLATVGDLVAASKADLGLIVDQSGERLRVIDDRGSPVPDAEFASVLVRVTGIAGTVSRITCPVNMPGNIASLAAELDLDFEWCGISPGDIAASVESGGKASLGVSSEGVFYLSGCTSSPDATAALRILLSGLAATGQRLSDLRSHLSVPAVVDGSVPVPYAGMGITMRNLRAAAESLPHDQLLLIDGIRLDKGGTFWFAAPDYSEPLIRLWAGASGREQAEALMEEVRATVTAARGI